jgi:outer membrane protein assembly factor BamE (lipoprotein component of BamABCDE complex)
MRRTFTALILISALTTAIAGCKRQTASIDGDSQRGALTQGAVEITVRKGETDQTTILEAFGPPDILTHKDNLDVWTYEKSTHRFEQRRDYFNVLITGTGGVSRETSSQSSMLILYFDEDGIVQDYRLSVVRY